MSFNQIRNESRIKVMMFIPNVMKRGGIESFLMSYFRNIDKRRITFIFCQMCSENEKGVFDKEIIDNGGFVEYVQFTNRHFFKSKKAIKLLLNKHNPDVIHVHGDADCVGLLCALKMCGSKNIICHSHNTNSSSNRNRFLIWIKRLVTSALCDYRFACSPEAGRWLFGKKKFDVIPNAICVSDFAFSGEKRLLLRKTYKIDDSAFVIGCVGHILLKHKHQDYLVEIAKLALKKQMNVTICLVGGGDDFIQLKNYCVAEKISNVIFTGEISNVCDYYSMFDVLALPSYYEGLGITCIEAICNGLFVVISDKVPLLNEKCDREFQIPATNEFMNTWLNELYTRAQIRYSDGEEYIEMLGFSIEKEANNLVDHYERISLK